MLMFWFTPVNSVKSYVLVCTDTHLSSIDERKHQTEDNNDPRPHYIQQDTIIHAIANSSLNCE